jgi:hypothetical protein
MSPSITMSAVVPETVALPSTFLLLPTELADADSSSSYGLRRLRLKNPGKRGAGGLDIFGKTSRFLQCYYYFSIFDLIVMMISD